MKKIAHFLVLVFFFLVVSFSFPKVALAHCPLCVAGAGAGLSLSRVLGIDDSITGVWFGAFLGASSFWAENIIKRKKTFPYLRQGVYLAIFVLSIWSLYLGKLVNKHSGTIFGIDKLTFGIIAGGLTFYAIDILDNLLIKKVGKVLFPYQRIIVSLASMILLSLGIYILINYFI